MVFSSITFLFYFLPIFLLAYYLLPWKNPVLLAASLVFYAWGEPRFVPLLLCSALLNYMFGYAISTLPQPRISLCLGIVANLAMLGYFKYFSFFLEIILQVFRLSPTGALPEIVLPLGISFFTFQGISYLIDVYRGDVSAQKSLLNFATYKAMFPQLIAGPIVRYHDVADVIERRFTSNMRIWLGLNIFVIGLVQKVLIANTVAVAADRIFSLDPNGLSSAQAWAGLASYSIQIFFDFCGYSNMAIGIGHMIGFKYPPNFNQPYASRSMTEFWRRWHMSLSAWFRDYLYIPLGGNRMSPWRTYLNLFVVFLLCGLWHGAAWTFILWGAWHGLLLILERQGCGKWLDRLPSFPARLYTLTMVMIGWVFFRADSVAHALAYLGALFGMNSSGGTAHPLAMHFEPATWAALLVGTLLALRQKPLEPLAPPCGVSPDSRTSKMELFMSGKCLLVRSGLLGALFILCAASLAAGTYNPFIYFRF
jgi:alginate O-acetyltransferase complex protein AlgI